MLQFLLFAFEQACMLRQIFFFTVGLRYHSKVCVGKIPKIFLKVSNAHPNIYLIKNTVQNKYFEIYYYKLKQLFYLRYFKIYIICVMSKLNFSSRYSSVAHDPSQIIVKL